MRLRFLAALFLLSGLFAAPVGAEELVQEPLRLTVTVPGTRGDETTVLEALLVRPDGPGPFPLAVINHGSPRKAEDRRERTPFGMTPQAREFARRGWAALVLMRRGYGASEAEFAEGNGPCKSPDYLTSGKRSADDIHAAIRVMAQKPYVDARRVISVGVSAGGFATVALTAEPPPGLIAGISFAGGRGSPSDGVVCAEDRLIDAFRTFGRRSRVPMLWVYAENDHYFGPALARQLASVFNGAGGNATLAMAPPFGEDGHTLFSGKGIPQWTPYVDQFLTAHTLAPRAKPMELTKVVARPPPALNERGREAFAKYLSAPGHKAFAVSPAGGFGWRTGRRSEDEAAFEALEYCEKVTSKRCRIYMVDDRVAE